jgi:hypothetical protein
MRRPYLSRPDNENETLKVFPTFRVFNERAGLAKACQYASPQPQTIFARLNQGDIDDR